MGRLPAKPHTVFRDDAGALLYEEMLTRGGFAGAFSYLYHRYPTTPNLELTLSTRGYPAPEVDPEARLPLRRILHDTNKIPAGGQLIDVRVPLYSNADLNVYFACPSQSDDVYSCNGDGDELLYFQTGGAKLESVFGWLTVHEGDYVWVPKGVIHRWHFDGAAKVLVFESPSGFVVPTDFRNPVGQLRMDAPYTHRDFRKPEGPIGAGAQEPTEMLTKRDGRFHRMLLPHSPMDVIGWEGFVYPWAFPIENFQPKTSSVHLPPTIHTTFAAKGALICSFVPRLVDTHPQAIPCPYPHTSVDCDEIILYVRGNFTSRKGVGPGCISLHPAGVPHGPHPGAYEASIGTTRTDELAVMVDTYLPLQATTQARALESREYHASWVTPA